MKLLASGRSLALITANSPGLGRPLKQIVNLDVLILILCVRITMCQLETGGITGEGSGKHLAMKQESGSAESMFRAS